MSSNKSLHWPFLIDCVNDVCCWPEVVVRYMSWNKCPIGVITTNRWCEGRQKRIMARRRKLLSAAIALVGAIFMLGVADWRDWIAWPDLISLDCKRQFDGYCILGEAPYCRVETIHFAKDTTVRCSWLSKEHCEVSNYLFLRDRPPEYVCVPNPLRN